MRAVASVLSLWSVICFAESPGQFLVVREEQAKIILPNFEGVTWTPQDLLNYRPQFGRVLKGFELRKDGELAGNWDVLLDDGRGNSVNGFVSNKSVAAFPNQIDAERFAEKIDIESSVLGSLYSPKDHSTSKDSGGHSSQSSNSASLRQNSSKEQSINERRASTRAIPWKAAAREGDSSQSLVSPALAQEDLELSDVRQHFSQAQQAMRKKLGSAFLAKLGKNYLPSSADRRAILRAAESLDPKDRAVFGMLATAWAEERESVGDSRCRNLTARSSATLVDACRNDRAGRANMLFTMKIVDNRSEPRKSNRQYMAAKYWNTTKLERMWGVMIKDRMFSSWNAGSSNFGNMLGMMLGEADHMPPSEHIALERAMRAYRDIVSGRAVFDGFVQGSKLTTHMLNPPEVRDLVRDPKDSGLVSWSMERVFNSNDKGLHQGGMRVPKFSIRFPLADDAKQTTVVAAKEMGHWPVFMDYLTCTKDKESIARAERLRKKQGAW